MNEISTLIYAYGQFFNDKIDLGTEIISTKSLFNASNEEVLKLIEWICEIY